jgi:hypothetical protein
MLLWIPFGIAGIALKANDWSSLIIAGAAAYLVGQLLQTLSIGAFPETVHDSGRRRYHSCIILDSADGTFTNVEKRNLAAAVKRITDIEISTQWTLKEGAPDPDSVDAVDGDRSSALLQCRALLLREKSIGYGEQYEGMLALMQGLSGAFLLSFAYTSGWALAHFNNFPAVYAHWLMGISLFVTLMASISVYLSRRKTPTTEAARKFGTAENRKRKTYRAAIYGFAFALLAGGYLLGQTTKTVNDPLVIHKLLAVAVVCLIFFFIAQAYVKSFSKYYGEEIWRNILLCDKSCGKSSAGGANGANPGDGAPKKS